MLECAPPNRSGGASGIQSTSRLLGQSLGAAVMTVLFALHGQHQLRLPLAMAAAMAAVGATTSLLRGARRPLVDTRDLEI